MAPPRHPLRSYIVALFRRGDLVSVQEATLICDASRQAVTKWLRAEGIDVEAHRLAYLAKLRTNGQRQIEGLPPLRRPTKAQMRKQVEDAMRRFNAANATNPGRARGCCEAPAAGGSQSPQMDRNEDLASDLPEL